MSNNSPARRRFRKPKAATGVTKTREIACWLDGGKALRISPLVPGIRWVPAEVRSRESWN